MTLFETMEIIETPPTKPQEPKKKPLKVDDRVTFHAPGLKTVLTAESWAIDLSQPKLLRQLVVEYFQKKYNLNPLYDADRLLTAINAARNGKH